ncbi:hypothetical protein HYPSUDRAFT_56670 [Hypholoma sublateritium FD-334 SS-4]|uniref:Uncharacterized protein n=1 Tax=Hypholoma sublateritium (strain FD-334 SS-4) TaxID=945553 RepID=A0A0D2PH41_HYPSF|nr:hypothetical protein HYPSUDRAFT_56670 [Hypholoma sublateritium FD-334 SS-4]
MAGRLTATVNRNIEELGQVRSNNGRSSTRKSGLPLRRSAATNANHKSVREHFRRLSVNYFQTRASADESKRFDEAKKENPGCESCTPASFRLYLDGPPRCEWNKSAARVFARSFVEYHNFAEDRRGVVLLEAQKMALTRIKTIKAEYNSRQLERHGGEKDGRMKHREIIAALGVDRVSEDESDYDELETNLPARTRAPRYYILHARWRNPALRPFLHVLDLIYCIVRRVSLRRRGAYTRQRQDSSTSIRYTAKSLFVPGCSISVYSPEWLASHADVAFVVRPSPGPYDFTHEPDVINLRTREQVYGPCGKVAQVIISPDGKFIAIGTVTKILTIHTRHGARPHPWGVVAELHEQYEQNSVQGFAGILWHPHVPRMLLVACFNGLIYQLSFDDPGDAHDVSLTTRHIINLPEECFHVGRGITMSHIAMNEAASEITAVIGPRLLTYGEPFSGHYTRADVYRECIPDRLVGQSPLDIWYISSTHVVIVYSTSIFVYVPAPPYLRIWTIDIPQARALVSATLSPDKTLLVGITQSGQADVYSLKTRRFVSTIGFNQVSLHGLATVTFFNWDKLLFSRDDDASLLVVADVLSPIHKLSKFVPFTKFDPLRIMGAGIIDGRYHIIVTRPYIADPANLNVVGLIVPDNFHMSDEIIEGSDHQVNKDESQVTVAGPAKPTEPAKLARFSFTQAAFVMHALNFPQPTLMKPARRSGGQGDLEIAHERPKPKLLSLIRAVVPDPMPEEKVEVIADLILAARSLDEIEGIIVTLRSELPLLTILTRRREVTKETSNLLPDIEAGLSYNDATVEINLLFNVFQVLHRRQSASYSVASYSASNPRSRAASVISDADIDDSEAASGVSHAASKISKASKTPRRNSLAPSDISYAPSNISHGVAKNVRRSPSPAEEIRHSPPLRARFNDDDSSPKVEEPRQMMAPVLMLTRYRLLTWINQIKDTVPLLNVIWDQGSVTNFSFSGSMFWTMSNSGSPLRFEDLFLDSRAVPGHIHIHNNNASANTPEVYLLEEQTDFNDRNTWTWRDITAVYTPELIVKPPFVLHPLHPDNALKLDENYVPRNQHSKTGCSLHAHAHAYIDFVPVFRIRAGRPLSIPAVYILHADPNEGGTAEMLSQLNLQSEGAQALIWNVPRRLGYNDLRRHPLDVRRYSEQLEEEMIERNATAPRLFSPPLPPELRIRSLRAYPSISARRTPGPHRRLVLPLTTPTANSSAHAAVSGTRSPKYLSEHDSDKPIVQTAPSSNTVRRASQPAVVNTPNSESDEYSTDTPQQAITPTRSKSALHSSATASNATNSKRIAPVAQESVGLESRGRLTHTAPGPATHPRHKQVFRIRDTVPSRSRSGSFIASASKGKRMEQAVQEPPESESEVEVTSPRQSVPSKTVRSPSATAIASAKGKRAMQTTEGPLESDSEGSKTESPQQPATPTGRAPTLQTPASKHTHRALSTTQSQEEGRVPASIASASHPSRASLPHEIFPTHEMDVGDDEAASYFSSVSTRHQKPDRVPKLRSLQDLLNAHGPVLGRGVRRLADASIKVAGKKEVPVAQFAHSQIHFPDTIWTVSDWGGAVADFDIVDAAPGNIHFHQNRLTDSVDIWMRTAEPKGWKQCTNSWLVYTAGAIADLHPLNNVIQRLNQFEAFDTHNDVSMQIFRRNFGQWEPYAKFSDRTNINPSSGVCAMIWHPVQTRQLVIGTVDGVLQGAFFEKGATQGDRMRTRLRYLCLNDNGTEISGIIDRVSFFTASEPWEPFGRLHVFGKDVIPTHLLQDTWIHPVGIWYGLQGIRMAAYRLGIFAVSAQFPYKLEWDIVIDQSRAISSGAMAPDRKTFVAVTESGDAEIYNLATHEFVAKVAHSTGSFRSIEQVIFYDRQSIVLVHKRRPDARGLERHAQVNIIAKLVADGVSNSFQLRVVGRRHSDIPTHSPVHKRLHTDLTPPFQCGGIIRGKGHLAFLTDLMGNIAVVSLEDIWVSRGMAFIVSSLADEETQSAIENSDAEDRESDGSNISPMEEDNNEDPGASNIAHDERHANESGIDILQTDEEDDRDSDNGSEALDLAVDIRHADEQSLLHVRPRDIRGPTFALPSPGEVVVVEQNGACTAAADYQPPGAVQESHYQPPGVTQTGGNSVSDLTPSFPTFIVCYCAVLAALILSSADGV